MLSAFPVEILLFQMLKKIRCYANFVFFIALRLIGRNYVTLF